MREHNLVHSTTARLYLFSGLPFLRLEDLEEILEVSKCQSPKVNGTFTFTKITRDAPAKVLTVHGLGGFQGYNSRRNFYFA